MIVSYAMFESFSKTSVTDVVEVGLKVGLLDVQKTITVVIRRTMC